MKIVVQTVFDKKYGSRIPYLPTIWTNLKKKKIESFSNTRHNSTKPGQIQQGLREGMQLLGEDSQHQSNPCTTEAQQEDHTTSNVGHNRQVDRKSSYMQAYN